MTSIGDIVTVRRFPGQRWAVVSPDWNNSVPQRRRWRLLSGRTARSVGDGDVVMLDHPQFTAGMRVKYRGYDATVLRDDGNTLRIAYKAARPHNLAHRNGTATEHVCSSDIDRGALVAERLGES